MKEKRYKIYTDFDGTIALNDVGDSLFATFAGEKWHEPIQDWKKGLISSKELYLREWEMTRLSPEQLEQFSDIQQIDPYFKDFVEYCTQHNYPLVVLSDGFDFYIKRILKKAGLDFLPVYANVLSFQNDNKVIPEFPYFGKGCPNCANCKGYHITKNQQQGELVVYIGDGLSDRCGVEQADIIFAKDDLKTYCLENSIAFFEFQNFKDVLQTIKQLPK